MAYAFQLPTADAILTESRLRPEQVDRDYLSSDLLSDIEDRIPGKADIVTRKLKQCSAPYPFPMPDELIEAALSDEAPDDVAATTEEQLSIATQAVEKLVLASLYGSAGQLNAAYFTRSTEYKDEANALLQTICEGIRFVKNPATGNASAPAPRPRSRQLTMTPRI